jgi:hypothetical protein
MVKDTTNQTIIVLAGVGIAGYLVYKFFPFKKRGPAAGSAVGGGSANPSGVGYQPPQQSQSPFSFGSGGGSGSGKSNQPNQQGSTSDYGTAANPDSMWYAAMGDADIESFEPTQVVPDLSGYQIPYEDASGGQSMDDFLNSVAVDVPSDGYNVSDSYSAGAESDYGGTPEFDSVGGGGGGDYGGGDYGGGGDEE